MKPHPKSIAALFAVFLALWGMNQAARAQTPSITNPYYLTETLSDQSTRTVILRIRSDSRFTGVFTSSTAQQPTSFLVYELFGTFDPSKNLLSGVATSPPPYVQSVAYRIEGTYDHLTDRFAIQLTRPGETSPDFLWESLHVYVGVNPNVVGVWQWVASDNNNPGRQFEGVFVIAKQDGQRISGEFLDAATADVGITGMIDGRVDGLFNSIAFSRIGTNYRQEWNGFVVNNGLTMEGAIKQESSGFDGTFTAGLHLAVPPRN